MDILTLTNARLRFWILVLSGIVPISAALVYVVKNAPPAVAAALVAASATILVSVFGTLASRHFERKREIEKEQRERKLEVYQQFMEYQFAVMQGRRKNLTEGKRKELDRNYRESFPQNLISWGSEDIIKKYVAWVKWDDPGHNVDILALEKILLAMREDLGYTNRGLEEGDLLKTFLKGVDERLKERKGN